MSRKKEVGIIGVGNMGRAIATALAEKNQYKVFVYDSNPLKTRQPGKFSVLGSTGELIAAASLVILAIKPQGITTFLAQNKQYLLKKKPLLVSIVAGISLQWFEKQLNDLSLIRVMPNLAARVRESISFISGGKFAKEKDLRAVKQIFSHIGEVAMIKEKYQDKVTAVTGSGPGYVFYFMESVYQGALKLGFSRGEAKKMVIQTFIGAIKLAQVSQQGFKTLIKKVTSKKGTTEAALKVFKAGKVDKVIIKGMSSAYQRAKRISAKLSRKHSGSKNCIT